MIEHVFIMEKTLELENAKDAISYTHNYNPGGILLCHIPTKERIHAKRRRNFDTLAKFINYDHGNALVQPYNTTQKIVLPIYCTKYLCKSIEHLNID
jgi:hypothetical protein